MDREQLLPVRKNLALLGLLFIAAGIVATVYLARQQQDIRQRAAGTGALTFVDTAGGQVSSTNTQTVRVKLTYTPTGQQTPTATPTPTGSSTTPTPTGGQQTPTVTPTGTTQPACTISGPNNLTAGAQYTVGGTDTSNIVCNTGLYGGAGTCIWGLLTNPPRYFADALASSKNNVTIASSDLTNLSAGTYQMFFFRNYGGQSMPITTCTKFITVP